MTEQEKEAIVAICLMAALADEGKSEPERGKMKEIFDTLGGGTTPAVYQRVFLKRTSPEVEAAALTSPETRGLAFEMAVSVCDADGTTTPPERDYLESLRRALELSSENTAPVVAQAEALASSPLEAAGGILPAIAATMPSPEIEADREADAMILRYAILNGGLELLPQSLATMAIVPLQMKMVYAIGKRYGFELSRQHVGELLATAGLGMGSQVLENYARRLLGGLFAKKKTLKGIAGAAVGAAMSFASTWAIGMVAKSYYAGGRRLDTTAIKSLFASKVEEGKRLFEQHRGEVEHSARSTSLTELLAMVGGKSPEIRG